MNALIRLRKTTPVFVVLFALACFTLPPTSEAVVPPPDGGYPGFNTAEGQNALMNLTTGVANTGNGWYSLFSNTHGSSNTAVGAGTLALNVGNQTTGEGFRNTAVGAAALLFNSTGTENTANGNAALESNDAGSYNTANGAFALFSNTIGSYNTATGTRALQDNTTGLYNTATGLLALGNNIGGQGNTATGYRALHDNTTGNHNTGIGHYAGHDLTGDGNVCFGANVFGVAGVDNTTWIRNVYDSVATVRAVYVNSDNKIGTLASSRRYKNEIRPMAKASEAIFSLRPVSFRYKKEVDPTSLLSFGLIAEEVAEVDPALVTPDRDGKPETVRYEAVNAMLLNEFLKEHNTVQEQGAKIARLERQIETLSAGLQKVSAQLATANGAAGMRSDMDGPSREADVSGSEQVKPSRGGLELSKSAPQTVLNNR